MTSYIPFIILIIDDYIQTSTGNIISRNSILKNPQAVDLHNGKCVIYPECVLHGELASIKIDKYCIINTKCIFKPCTMISPHNNMKYISLSIGPYCYFGENCVIESAVIGLGCHIGNNCCLGARTILKDHVFIESNTYIPSDMVIPPFAMVSGNPGRIVGYMSESAATTARSVAMMRYKSFILQSCSNSDAEVVAVDAKVEVVI